MTDIFQEVEEDLRNEQYRRLWNRYGPGTLAVIGAVLAITIAWAVWDTVSEGRRQAQSAVYEAFWAGEPEGQKVVEGIDGLAPELGGGYAILAKLDKAAGLVETEKWAEARALFEEVAADSAAPRQLRDVASLKAAYLVAETASLPDMQSRLATLAAPSNPLRISAGELLGYVAYRTGDIEAARGYFAGVLAEQTVPRDQRERIEDLSAAIAATAPADATANPVVPESNEGPASPAASTEDE